MYDDDDDANNGESYSHSGEANEALTLNHTMPSLIAIFYPRILCGA